MNKSNRTAANIIMTIIIIWLLIPLAATIIYSLFADWTGLVPEGFTLSSYVTIFTNQAFLTAIYQTLLICVVPILITILIVLLALFVVTIYFPQFEKYLQILCMVDAFKAAGVPEEDAKICADVLMESDRRGIESHGTNRFKPIYIDRINAGILNPVTNYEVLKETPTTLVADAHARI